MLPHSGPFLSLRHGFAVQHLKFTVILPQPLSIGTGDTTPTPDSGGYVLRESHDMNYVSGLNVYLSYLVQRN